MLLMILAAGLIGLGAVNLVLLLSLREKVRNQQEFSVRIMQNLISALNNPERGRTAAAYQGASLHAGGVRRHRVVSASGG